MISRELRNISSIRNAQAVDADGVRHGVEIQIHDGRIRAIIPEAPRAIETSEFDADGLTVVPGFVDVHVHGALGSDFGRTRSTESAQTVADFHLAHGTTSMLAGIPSLPLPETKEAISAIRPLVNAPGSTIVGVHLEGPFISPGHLGAHPLEYVRPASIEEMEDLLDTAQGTIRLISYAPEVAGAESLYRIARENGIVLAVGHTSATYEQARRGFDLGARQVTHTMNAMPQPEKRAPGPIAAAIEDDRVVLEVVLDGLHVQEPAVRMLYRAVGPQRLAVITDAAGLTGLDLADGMHSIGDSKVEFRGGLPRVPGTDTIAGSTLTMDRALLNIMAFTGVDLAEAIQMTSATPARAAGLGDRKGRIAVGFDADLVLLDPHLSVQRVVLHGALVS